MLWINIYAVERHYGGPEEGGWWYDSGTPVGSIPVELTHEEIMLLERSYWTGKDYNLDRNHLGWREVLRQATKDKAWELAEPYEELYPNTGNSSSVLGGEDYRVAVEDEFAQAYPTERPRYE